MSAITKAAFHQLYDLAANQEGYFTAKQAKLAGFTDSTHPYHVKNGDWSREWRGIYRINNYPQLSARPELMMWQLWSRDRNDVPQAVFSHETALDIYNLSDDMPDKLHITVPKTFRRSQEIPSVITLHYEDFSDSDLRYKSGIRITSPIRTIGDLIRSDTLPRQTLKNAIHSSFYNGLILRSEIEDIRETLPESIKAEIFCLAQETL